MHRIAFFTSREHGIEDEAWELVDCGEVCQVWLWLKDRNGEFYRKDVLYWDTFIEPCFLRIIELFANKSKITD